jgi:hypothetical protein
VTVTTVTTFRIPPRAASDGWQPEDHPEQRPAPRADDVRVLADRVAGESHHDARWRATAAARLATVATDHPELLSDTVVRRLDAALPRLLLRAGAGEAGALVALCAALGDRLSSAVCAPLQRLVRDSDVRLAVAAHVASLVVEGLTPSAQHLADLAAAADVDPRELAPGHGRPLHARAAVLAYALTAGDG